MAGLKEDLQRSPSIDPAKKPPMEGLYASSFSRRLAEAFLKNS